MNERDIGKTGNKKRIIAVIIIIVIVIASIGAVLLFPNSDQGDTFPYHVSIRLETINTDGAWIVKVEKIGGNYDEEWYQQRMNDSYVEYKLYYNRSETSPYNLQSEESSPLAEINATQSPMGVLWVNLNDTNLVEVGDYLIVNKSGGSKGKAAAHDILFLEWPYAGSLECVYLPPDDFLGMEVEKTDDGWNMTVTWVDETMPEALLDAWNVSFRLENKSGEFLTSYRNDHSFWLGFIRHPLPEYNHVDQGFYTITWYDYDENRIISLNDTFVIDNYSSLVEADYTLRLMSNRYSYGYTIIEVILI